MAFDDSDNRNERDLDLVDAYDYELPDDLIAAHPAERRAQSKLLVARRDEAELEHRRFVDIVDYLREGDLLVFNNTRVIPSSCSYSTWSIRRGPAAGAPMPTAPSGFGA
jgi:hypothetical protein